VTTIETEIGRDVTQALETMLLIRAFEEKSAALQASGRSPSMCTSVGQEASATGVMRALGERDLIERKGIWPAERVDEVESEVCIQTALRLLVEGCALRRNDRSLR